MVKRLRRNPLKVESPVRFRAGSPNDNEPRFYRGFLFYLSKFIEVLILPDLNLSTKLINCPFHFHFLSLPFFSLISVSDFFPILAYFVILFLLAEEEKELVFSIARSKC